MTDERSLTLNEMAAMIGTTPVMVCKLLSRIADDGLIRVTRTEFEFIDQEKLSQIAGAMRHDAAKESEINRVCFK